MKSRFSRNHKRKQTRSRKNYMRRKKSKVMGASKKYKHGRRNTRRHYNHTKKRLHKGG